MGIQTSVRLLFVKDQALLPPATSDPAVNPDHAMIDAQLTTESFGLMAPGLPEVALNWPIANKRDGQWRAAAIARFYVVMHALAIDIDRSGDVGGQLRNIAAQAATELPESGYAHDMYQFVPQHYLNPDNDDWELTRDAVFERYQQQGSAGYGYQRPFDAGINFAASLVSLFYGEGNYKRTVQIASLADGTATIRLPPGVDYWASSWVSTLLKPYSTTASPTATGSIEPAGGFPTGRRGGWMGKTVSTDGRPWGQCGQQGGCCSSRWPLLVE